MDPLSACPEAQQGLDQDWNVCLSGSGAHPWSLCLVGFLEEESSASILTSSISQSSHLRMCVLACLGWWAGEVYGQEQAVCKAMEP